MDDYWVWCGSVIQGEDGHYHMFASRWPKSLPFFQGYIACSEIVRAESDTPEGPYIFQEIVLGDRGEAFWDGRMTHNPAIRKVGDTYLLFYIGATYPGAKPDAAELSRSHVPVTTTCYHSIRIGMATAKSIKGPWLRPDKPILEPRPGKWDCTVVTNPAPCILDNGFICLYYRSNTPEGLKIGVAGAKDYASPFYRLKDEPALTLIDGGQVEDPFVWRQDGHFEMIAKDMTGEITGEKHAGIHALSADGLEWFLADPPKAYSRRVIWDNGAVTIQGSLERPQLLFCQNVPTHLFAATADGPGGFDQACRTWNMVIPLKSM
ncbi:MAG: glycoside hydrolase family protein [Clostridiaceae bacterium]|nr:glycoside hydrolase family protein [Clostridiaceae bacterium]